MYTTIYMCVIRKGLNAAMVSIIMTLTNVSVNDNSAKNIQKRQNKFKSDCPTQYDTFRVTSLGYFRKILSTNVLTKVAHRFCNIRATFKSITLYLKTILANFRSLLEKIGSFLFQHLVTLVDKTLCLIERVVVRPKVHGPILLRL